MQCQGQLFKVAWDNLTETSDSVFPATYSRTWNWRQQQTKTTFVEILPLCFPSCAWLVRDLSYSPPAHSWCVSFWLANVLPAPRHLLCGTWAFRPNSCHLNQAGGKWEKFEGTYCASIELRLCPQHGERWSLIMYGSSEKINDYVLVWSWLVLKKMLVFLVLLTLYVKMSMRGCQLKLKKK